MTSLFGTAFPSEFSVRDWIPMYNCECEGGVSLPFLPCCQEKETEGDFMSCDLYLEAQPLGKVFLNCINFLCFCLM